MSNKNFILITSLVINIVLGYLFLSNPSIEDLESVDKALKESEIKIEEISIKDSLIQVEIDSINLVKQALEDSLLIKSKERVVIKKVYYEKIDSIIRLSNDSSVSYISRRLSEVKLD